MQNENIPNDVIFNTSNSPSFDGGDTDHRLHDASSILEYQQLYSRNKLCLALLRDSTEEVEALRLENDSLRFTNADLSRRLAILFSRERIISDFSGLNLASPSSATHLIMPTQPLNDNYIVERRSTERITLPKSISVRSSGTYQKMTPTKTDHKSMSQPAAAASQQRVCLQESKNEEALEIEMDVYKQGKWKTELCNKWQETGVCPYQHNCRFAHGIKELRPVIRHPRYKTEVCRVVMAGDVCPYGHRCHFRHSLSEQEQIMAAQPSR